MDGGLIMTSMVDIGKILKDLKADTDIEKIIVKEFIFLLYSGNSMLVHNYDEDKIKALIFGDDKDSLLVKSIQLAGYWSNDLHFVYFDTKKDILDEDIKSKGLWNYLRVELDGKDLGDGIIIDSNK